MFLLTEIYSEWIDPHTGQPIFTFSIITTEPNEVVKKVHPREPAILKGKDEKEYLNPDIIEPERILPLLKPFPGNEMESYQVRRDVASYKNDYADIIKPVAGSPQAQQSLQTSHKLCYKGTNEIVRSITQLHLSSSFVASELYQMNANQPRQNHGLLMSKWSKRRSLRQYSRDTGRIINAS
jgi:SOS response associated peptidase (SRAP)